MNKPYHILWFVYDGECPILQWSWIHLEDIIGFILYAINTSELTGIFNLTAPTPVTNREFVRALGRAMHRPAMLPIPAFIIKLFFGKMGNDILLNGKKVIPTNVLRAGYNFIYSDIDHAFMEIFAKKQSGI